VRHATATILMMRTRPLPQPFAPDDERGLHQVEAEAADPALREARRMFGSSMNP